MKTAVEPDMEQNCELPCRQVRGVCTNAGADRVAKNFDQSAIIRFQRQLPCLVSAVLPKAVWGWRAATKNTYHFVTDEKGPHRVFHTVAPNVRVRVVRDMPPISDALSRDVERVWDIEQSRLKSQLFNGRVFSADVISPNLVCGHWTEFRRIVAQMRRPDLHPALGIRPLAVGGVLIGPDGVVFGQRPALSVYQGGEWQLPPAGSVDLTAARRHGRVDYAAMLLAELREEVGLDAHEVQIIGTVGIVEHPGSHVMDLGIAMLTHLSADAIVSRHRSRGNGEYDPLKVVPVAELDCFLKQPNMTLQAPLFLRALRGIDPTHNGLLRMTSR